MKAPISILASVALLNLVDATSVAQKTSSDLGSVRVERDTRSAPNPINVFMAVLDSNRDGILSKQEVDGAAEALRKLDTNKDGRIDPQELRRIGPRQKRRITPETSNARRHQLSGFTKLIMEFDKNKDGKVTKAELPKQMHRIFETADTNKDGSITLEEAEWLGNPSKRSPRRSRINRSNRMRAKDLQFRKYDTGFSGLPQLSGQGRTDLTQ